MPTLSRTRYKQLRRDHKTAPRAACDSSRYRQTHQRPLPRTRRTRAPRP